MAKILILRIELVGAEPMIWRTVEVSSDLDLMHVGHVIQIAMGWENVHLQAFHNRHPWGSHADEPLISWQHSQFMEDPEDRDLEQTTLSQALELTSSNLYFSYDFGDGWLHKLEVLGSREATAGEPRMQVLDGSLRAPIEDSGGLCGWYGKLDAIRTQDSNGEYEFIEQWMQWRVGPLGNINPEVFDIDRANRMLQLHEAGYDGSTVLGRWLQSVPEESRRYFGRIVSSTQLTLEPSFEEPLWLDAVLKPFQVLIQMSSEDGIKLTQAGWMPPKIVGELVAASNWDGINFESPTNKRENNMFSVAGLRQAALQMKLVRHYKGTLKATTRGLKLAESTGDLKTFLINALVTGLGSEDVRIQQTLALVLEEAGLSRFSISEDIQELIENMMNAFGYRYLVRPEEGPYTLKLEMSDLWSVIITSAEHHLGRVQGLDIKTKKAELTNLRHYLLSGFEQIRG